jgi:hypothetical protein
MLTVLLPSLATSRLQTWLYPAEVRRAGSIRDFVSVAADHRARSAFCLQITPLRIRAPANGLSTASNWIFNL